MDELDKKDPLPPRKMQPADGHGPIDADLNRRRRILEIQMEMRNKAAKELSGGPADDEDAEKHLARLAQQRSLYEERMGRLQQALDVANKAPTFTPQITEYAESLEREENVFDRLYYNKQLSPSKSDVAKAKRTATRAKAEPGTSVVVPAASRAPRAAAGDADEAEQAIEVLLYQDAEVRRKKRELLHRERVETENVLRNKSKISKATRDLAVASIRKKIEALFKDITRTDRAQLLTRAKLDLALQQLGFFPASRPAGKATPAAELEIGNRLWAVMDPTDAGRVSLAVFRRTLSYIMDPTYSGGKAEADGRAETDGKAEADGDAAPATEDDDDARAPVPAGLPELRRRLYMMRLVNHGSRRMNEELVEEVRRQEMQECTFNPTISEASRKLDHEATARLGLHVDRSEVLYQRAAKAKMRRENVRLEKDAEVLKECTFHPKISSTSRRLANRANGDGADRLEKLSAHRVRVEQPTTEELRAAECTFKPDTALTAQKTARVKAKILEPRNGDARPQTGKKMSAAERERAMERTVRGAEAYIRRMEHAKRAAEEKRRAYERVGRVPKAKDLQRVRKLKPFKFEHDAKVRQAAHAQAGCAVDLGAGGDEDEPEIRPVAMYMDVNLGAGRSGRLAIHAMDNPHVLAHNFAAIYGLNAEMTQALEAMVLAHMEQMDIPISTSMAGKVRRRLPGSDRAAQMPHLTPEDIEASRRSPSPKRRDMSPFREPSVSVRRPGDEQRKIRRKKKVRRPSKAGVENEQHGVDDDVEEATFTYVPHAHAKLDLSVHDFEEPQAPSSRLSPRGDEAAFGSDDDVVEAGPTESWQIRFDAPVQPANS